MTNFQPDQASKGLSFITPERALLLLPVLAGIVLSGAIAGFALVPAVNKLQELEKLEKENLKKRADLPGLVRGKGRLLQQEARSKGATKKAGGIGCWQPFIGNTIEPVGSRSSKSKSEFRELRTTNNGSKIFC